MAPARTARRTRPCHRPRKNPDQATPGRGCSSKLAATIPRGLEFRGRNQADPENANGEERNEAQPHETRGLAQMKNGAQLALDLPPGEARRTDRRGLPRLDLIQLALNVRLMRGEKARYSARCHVWISDHGRTWWAGNRKKPWQLTPGTERKNPAGYVTSHWPGWKERRCRIMAEAWIGPRPPGLVVRHLDDDRLNDAPWNLAWGTRVENHTDAIHNGRRPPRKLSSAACIGALLTMRSGETDAACATRNGVSKASIQQLRSGKQWRHIAPCLPRRAEWKEMQR